MYYAHLLDGSGSHRSSIIVVTQDSAAPHRLHNVGGSPLVDEDGNPQAYDTKWTIGPIETPTEAKGIVLAIAQRYNWLVEFDGDLLRSDDPRFLGLITSRQAQAQAMDETGDDVPVSSITHACRQGHIRNAQKQGRDWVFPSGEFWRWLNNRPKPGRKPAQ